MPKKQTILLSIILVLAISGLLALYFLYNPATNTFFPKCVFYTTTNLYCPGCGSQRAIHNILKGNILNGIRHNILIVLLFLVLIYKAILFILKLLLKKEYNSLLNNPIVTKSILVFVLAYWILRNISSYPFTLLAP
ncbi:DUF2752 domain-containing protein [Lacinutrix sp.]|uniref:DUF2752 domain-containing protein n=1 Tax=Lacinutrix sp. TaxID=1937692 RepID=UPI0035C86AA7